MKHSHLAGLLLIPIALAFFPCELAQAESDAVAPIFNRAPLVKKPYAELPLGAIEPMKDKCVGILATKLNTPEPKRLSASEKGRLKGKPNFVFFITDDISPRDLGIYGNDFVHTPNLDALAKRALVFDNAFLTTSSCSPSRCSIITGRYPHNTGAPELHNPLPPDQPTFVNSLRKAGYHTILSGKNHMGPNTHRLGFEVRSDSKPAGAEQWVDHLRDRPQDRPFFAWFASHDAHHPFTPNDKAPTYDPAAIRVPPMMADGPLTRQELANYYHEVSRTDHYVGELFEELKRQGIAENTYFIYFGCVLYLSDGKRKPATVFPVIRHPIANRSTKAATSQPNAASCLARSIRPRPSIVRGRCA
ncbi:sulfatase-like hydrolase/transferase [Rhodopirellula sp. JC639]|uniref:sulfatase-like hydrolase/transferase n=1 Tax=Stieleria mannarensis TaxID=2755585 RepID=UPI001600CC70|nr:sulfatase-like hydrolase/transferase [Rhodopirellula sp. JC639]